MRILMLGWEFPPFIAGGLGVACYGLTKALDARGHNVTFILPKPIAAAAGDHVRLLGTDSPVHAAATGTSTSTGTGTASSVAPASVPASGATTSPVASGGSTSSGIFGFQNTRFVGVSASFSSPYPAFDQPAFLPLADVPSGLTGEALTASRRLEAKSVARDANEAPKAPASGPPGAGFGPDLVGDAERYARLVVALASREQFDVIHAHDWLTYPAGIAVARVSGKPLVVHVHSTEFDRAGNNINQRTYDIEKAGMLAATRVVAVSQFTRSVCIRRYGVPAANIDVVYNGIEQEASQPKPTTRIESADKVVLFLGRITMQKGPEYFIAAAKRVLEKMENVKFVLAGSGDMAVRMIELAASMGIGDKVLFTGFLRGDDVDKVFQMADCYVMPSVSEPFGLAALEAIRHDVPVIISKTSGASEVLKHVLKVDFWDIDEMANKILAVLRHPVLGAALRAGGAMELHRLTWKGAAEACTSLYDKAVAAHASASKS